MSPNSLRVLAGTAAAVIVLLTGIAVGFIGAAPECPAPAAPANQQPTTQPTSAAPSPTSTSGVDNNPNGGINENKNGGNNGGGNVGGGVGGGTTEAGPPPVDSRPQETAPKTTDVAAPAPACEGEKFSIPAALAGIAGAGLASVTLLALLLAAQSRRPAPVPVSGPPAAGGPSRGSADPRLDADRAALVRACIYVRDRVTSRALADRLAAALRDAGVNVVEPVGERFDPGRHEAGGATPTKDPTQTGTIAAVEVPGYVDRTGRVLRAPVVTVYQAGAGPAAHGGPPSGAVNAVTQPSGAYPTVNPPSGAYPTVNPPSGAHPTVTNRTGGTTQPPRRRTEEDR
jgi:hypothetical protein